MAASDRTEAVVLCIDNSDHMRNEDYVPSRWAAQNHGVSWIFNSIGASHAFGLVSMAGRRPEVLAPVVTDITALHHSLDRARISGECNIKASLHLAQMILRNRPPRCTVTRVIMFSGSPIQESVEGLLEAAKSYRKNGIALDIICFGDAPADILQQVVNIADHSGNSHFIQSSCDDPTLSVSVMDILLPDDLGILPPTSSSARRSLVESEPPPVLRMPPPNRVCRRVVVDHTKYSAQKSLSSPLPSTLSLSLTLSLSTPRNESGNSSNTRPGAGEKDSRLVLLVPLPSQRNKKILLEFRAGRCQASGTTVRPLKKRGQLALLQISDDILQFVWRDRVTGAVEMDTLVHSREAKFLRVPQHISRDRVYCLHLTESHKRHFFWMQHNDVEKDEEYCETINSYLSMGSSSSSDTHHPPSALSLHSSSSHSSTSSSSSSSIPLRAQYHTLSAADLQQLLALYSFPLSLPSSSSRGGATRSSSSSSALAAAAATSQALSRGSRASRWASQVEDTEGPFRGKWIKNPLWTQTARSKTNRGSDEESMASLSDAQHSPHTHTPATSTVLLTSPAALISEPSPTPILSSSHPSPTLIPIPSTSTSTTTHITASVSSSSPATLTLPLPPTTTHTLTLPADASTSSSQPPSPDASVSSTHALVGDQDSTVLADADKEERKL